MNQLKNEAKLLRRDGIEALLNFEVWWGIRNPDNSKLYSEIFDQYSAYFQAAVNAHFVAMVLPLYRIFETKNDRINLPELIKKLRSNSALKESVLNDFEDRLNSIKPTWIKIAILRNEVFGHRSNKYSVSQSFERAGLTVVALEKFIESTLELLNVVDSSLNEEYSVFKMGAGEDLLGILNFIKSKQQK